jgi:septal ring factor EnvC (AmiA/AmiB activator)
MRQKIFLLAFCISVVFIAFAQPQGKEDLQKKEAELKREISELTASLEQIQKNKKSSLAQVAAVQQKIAAREALIGNINKQVKLLVEDIYKNELEIYRLQKELDTLKIKYAQSIVFAYKNRSNYQYLNFLFSATNFNDAIKRVTYLKSYRTLRETQVDNIVKTQSILQNKIGELNNSKKEQGVVLKSQQGHLQDLEQDKKQKAQVVKDLKGQEKEISAQIRKKELQRQQMKNAIAAIIKREIAEAERKARIAREKEIADAKKLKEQQIRDGSIAKSNPSTTTPTTKPNAAEPITSMTTAGSTSREYSKLESTDELKGISINFEKNRGNLPWPVGLGTVVIPFGPYDAGGKLKGYSDGIEIGLPLGSSVKSVADGKISYAGDVGGEMVVIVKHGKYFTTYSHLSEILVNKDQEIKAGTLLGKSGSGDDGQGTLLFMVTNDKNINLNPKSWLKAR